jgi:hypothetical protein
VAEAAAVAKAEAGEEAVIGEGVEEEEAESK